MSKTSYRKITAKSVVIAMLFSFSASSVFAASAFSVAPLLIEHETEGRDIITKDITLTNHTDRPTRIYAAVNEVSLGDNAEIKEFVPASMGDRQTSITSWIEITRARLELPARGELKVPLTVKIHPTALPGEYHAFIGFASGANRDEIEAKVRTGQGDGVILKIVIAEDINEQVTLVSFVTEKVTLSSKDSNMSFTLENTGDTAITPQGEVIIYNTKGNELSSVQVNTSGTVLLPGERKVFTEELPFTNHLGRNKAYLSLNYGVNNKAAIFDTAFYYSIPWHYLAILFSVLLIMFGLIVYGVRSILVDRKAYSFEHGVRELPLFVRDVHDHDEKEHDLNLRHDPESK